MVHGVFFLVSGVKETNEFEEKFYAELRAQCRLTLDARRDALRGILGQ